MLYSSILKNSKVYINRNYFSYNPFWSQLRYCTPYCNVEPPTFPHTKTSILPNGIRVATEESGSSMATISMFIEAGSRYETACNNGVTHFIEHMAYKGFSSMDKKAFEDSVYNLGVRFGAKTTRDMLVFNADTFPKNVEKILTIYFRIITELELADYNIEQEKKNICFELSDADEDPKQVVFDYLHSAAYQGTPLAQRVMGPPRNIQKFNKDFVTKFMLDQFQPWRIVIAGSGGLDHQDFACQTQKVFGNFEGTACGEQEYGPTRFTGSQVLYRDDSMPFAHVIIAVEVPGYGSEEYFNLKVASEIIGSWNRSQGGDIANPSRLARAAANAHICESFESFYIAYKGTGLFGIYFVCDKMAIEDMLYNVQDDWMKLTICTTQSEVKRGANALKLKIAKQYCGTINSCYDMGEQIMYSCKRLSLSEIFHKLDDMKTNGIQSIGDKYIYDQCPVVAGVGPVENLPEYTRIRASMYWLRL